MYEKAKSRFNSTMVRLKVCLDSLTSVSLHCFNSTMVRLKVLIAGTKEPTESGFNSTMVRLKASNKGDYFVLNYLFQFHNGSIKSRAMP